jgi:hypothetical protein
VPIGRPQLELGVGRRTKANQIRVSTGHDIERGDDLGVAPVESFRQPEHRGQRPHGAAETAFERAVTGMALLRRRLAMVAREQRDDLDFRRIEAAQFPIRDQVVRMAMVTLVADVDADVVQERGIFEPLAFPIAEPVHRARLIEE